MTETSKEAVERLCSELSRFNDSNAHERAIFTLRQLLTERDAEKARADKAEWKFVALAFAVENGRRGTFQDGATEETVDKALDLHKQLTAANEKLASAREVVEQQATDEGLWFLARTAPEAYLQVALRNLHAAVEGPDALGNATHPTTPASAGILMPSGWHAFMEHGLPVLSQHGAYRMYFRESGPDVTPREELVHRFLKTLLTTTPASHEWQS